MGTIFSTQKFSLHDGPGIRTTVFFKGCPLNCLWCHNPESQRPGQELMSWPSRCLACGACLAICPSGAISMTDGKALVDLYTCSACGLCASACGAQAKEMVGEEIAADQVMARVMKDLIFYDESGGGVTFSGGEPLMQPQFLKELLSRSKAEGLQTTVDTSGFADWSVLEDIAPLTDLFLYDVKVMADEKHVRYTGVSNKVILENLRKLIDRGSKVQTRIPLIPGANDDEENLRRTGEFLQSIGARDVSLLPYHAMGSDKYLRLQREYSLANLVAPTDEAIGRATEVLSSFGLDVKTGG